MSVLLFSVHLHALLSEVTLIAQLGYLIVFMPLYKWDAGSNSLTKVCQTGSHSLRFFITCQQYISCKTAMRWNLFFLVHTWLYSVVSLVVIKEKWPAYVKVFILFFYKSHKLHTSLSTLYWKWHKAVGLVGSLLSWSVYGKSLRHPSVL